MYTAKSIRTLSLSRTSLTFTNRELFIDPTEYKSIAVALQYLNMMRPNISYAVHVVS